MIDLAVLIVGFIVGGIGYEVLAGQRQRRQRRQFKADLDLMAETRSAVADLDSSGAVGRLREAGAIRDRGMSSP